MTEQKLQERVKELGCLYAVARISQAPDKSLDQTLKAMLTEIPQGWQFPEKALAQLHLDGQEFGASIPEEHCMQTMVLVNNEVRGKLIVGYPNDMDKVQESLFLPEEQQLLGKLAIEIALVIERHEHREQHKALQDHLLSTDRLNVLGEITAGIAHELNTPLGNILGYAELLLQNEQQAAPKADLQRIVDAGLIARGVVKKLMYFSCEMPSQFLPLDVNQALKDSLRLLAKQLNDRDTNLKWELTKDLPLIRADAIQFSQVITNLVLNALDAISVGGQLRISTECDKKNVRVKITDNGAGIPPEHINRIQQPFFTTKPTGKGSGLGLSVVHGIIKAHSAHMKVRSELGSGTTFTLTFPLAD